MWLCITSLLNIPVPEARFILHHPLRLELSFLAEYTGKTLVCQENLLFIFPRGSPTASSGRMHSIRLFYLHEISADRRKGEEFEITEIPGGSIDGRVFLPCGDIEHIAVFDGELATLDDLRGFPGDGDDLSLRMTPNADASEIKVVLVPPQRNVPKTIYLRLRHPQEKRIQSVTLNGSKYEHFDVGKEWVVLPGSLQGTQEVVVHYIPEKK